MNCVTDVQPTLGVTPSVNCRAAVALARAPRARGRPPRACAVRHRLRVVDEHREELERSSASTDHGVSRADEDADARARARARRRRRATVAGAVEDVEHLVGLRARRARATAGAESEQTAARTSRSRVSSSKRRRTSTVSPDVSATIAASSCSTAPPNLQNDVSVRRCGDLVRTRRARRIGASTATAPFGSFAHRISQRRRDRIPEPRSKEA